MKKTRDRLRLSLSISLSRVDIILFRRRMGEIDIRIDKSFGEQMKLNL